MSKPVKTFEKGCRTFSCNGFRGYKTTYNRNVLRNRFYGIRIGDIVKSMFQNVSQAEVIAYGYMDNNSVFIKEKGKPIRDVVAEWCTIITKVEDR